MSDIDKQIADWRRLSSEIIEDFKFFRLRKDISRHPTSGREHRFFIFEFPDWVNIMPITPEREVVFVNQFRHGTREVDAGDSGRDCGPGRVGEGGRVAGDVRGVGLSLGGRD